MKDCKNCESCVHFYECDNMGMYEECLPDMKNYEANPAVPSAEACAE